MSVYRDSWSGGGILAGLPRGVRTLLVVLLVVFVIHFVAENALLRGAGYGRVSVLFGLSLPGLLHGFAWQPLTYMFLHAGPWHLLMNLLGLVFFGREVEELMGTRRFVQFFLFCGLLGGMGWLVLSAGGGGVCVGASGAVFGIMGAFGALFPDRVITLLLFFVLPVSLTARTLVLVLGGLGMLALMSGEGGVAHAAHLGGGLAGYGVGLRIRRRMATGQFGAYATADHGASLWTDVGAWARRRRLRVVEGGAAPDPEEIDRILEKVHAQGMASLSRAERRTLEAASRKEWGHGLTRTDTD